MGDSLRISCIYGPYSQSLNGPFRLTDLFIKQALTGSESAFWALAAGFAELGHRVTAYCDAVPVAGKWGPVDVRAPVARATAGGAADSAAITIAWNEPDLLAGAKGLRVCAQQLNDFSYAKPDFDQHADLYVSPSEHHRQHLIKKHGIAAHKVVALPNPWSFAPPVEQISPADRGHRIVYCSSPDRGLHWLCQFFPEIRRRVPDVKLDIFYTLDRWLESTKDQDNEFGRRSRYIAEFLRRFGRDGERGVRVRGSVPNAQMVEELSRAALLVYPLDPIAYTEGFGVAILDALGAGCRPIISDRDAPHTLFGEVATVIHGAPGARADAWVDAVVQQLGAPLAAGPGWQLAARYRPALVAEKWLRVLRAARARRKRA